MLTEKELASIKQMLDLAESNLRQAKKLLFSAEISEKIEQIADSKEGENIVEGVFDGEKMISHDKKSFHIPANYASKSKLVSGDILKLTIMSDGAFQYKQIGPVERQKKIGQLEEASAGRFTVLCDDGNEYQVLPASITFFKAKEGDKLTILVPKDLPSEWAAVENLLESK